MDQTIRTQFFEDADGGFPSLPQPKSFMKVWNKVVVFEDNIGKALDDGYTKEEYIALFNFTFSSRSSVFCNHKRTVMLYIRYLIEHNVLPVDHERILASISIADLSIKNGSNRIRYFKNLSQLRDAIEDTVKAAGRVDETVYDVNSAILYLAWYGLTEEQVLTLPKTAVLEDGIILDGQKIEMPFFVTNLLTRLRDAKGFYSQARGVIFCRYMYSDYLIRTKDNYQLTVFQMRSNISRMNAITDHIYSLRFDTVRQSGIFYRAYMLECESSRFDLSDPVFASEVFCEDFIHTGDLSDPDKPLRERTRDYMLFKQLFS